MHWFWRAVTAAAIGTAFGIMSRVWEWWFQALLRMTWALDDVLVGVRLLKELPDEISFGTVFLPGVHILTTIVVALSVYGVMTRAPSIAQPFALSVAMGAFASAILSGQYWFFGLSAGVLYAVPTALLMGVVARLRRWPGRLVIVACACQLLVALAAGFGSACLTALRAPDDPRNPAVGVLASVAAGAVLGILISEWFRRRMREPGECLRCGYNLTGNISGVCPECGGRI